MFVQRFVVLRLALVALTISLGLSTSTSLEARGLLGTLQSDKSMHAAVAGASGLSCSILGTAVTKSKITSLVGCFILVNSLGVAKELTDKSRGGNPELEDIYANMLGSGMSALGFRMSF